MSDNKMILKHPISSRVFHWFLLLSFLPLAATGLLLFFKPLDQAGMQLSYDIHMIAGAVMAIDAVAFFIFAFDRVVLFTYRVFAVSKRDIGWMMVAGGYPHKFFPGIFKTKPNVPEMNKYNTGQRIFGAAVIVGGSVLIISGLVLWLAPHIAPAGAVYWLGQAHLVFGLLLTAFLPVHLFLAVYFWSDFKAMMSHGKIPYEDAKHHSPLWVKNEIVPTMTAGEQAAAK
ncbi:cytochrome b/b6 domain-containing protein [Ferrimonas senticii]|uniref:cytochrome b/b6 domain-containing protein n=1 Tax=Ferrimonas senticii TaxID=394566 RepID=UPI00041E2280|nr:cytochrome b/b6 domain-containing protein [Ferrimonas senticii]